VNAELPVAKPLKIPRSVLVIAFTPQREVLLIERADFAGFWQSVTGSQEKGESWAATAQRELLEETGFDASLYGGVIDLHYRNAYCIYPRWRHRYPPDVSHNEERCFAVCLPSAFTPRLAEREHVAYEWMSLESAALRATSWSNVCALRNLALQFGSVVNAPSHCRV
jgi:dihydroneopterin triphosphate diphosphatase